MALNMCEMWFNCIKIAFVIKKLQKIAQQLETSLPRPQKPPAAGGPAPRLPVCDTFELHWLSQNVFKVAYLYFSTILV